MVNFSRNSFHDHKINVVKDAVVNQPLSMEQSIIALSNQISCTCFFIIILLFYQHSHDNYETMNEGSFSIRLVQSSA